MESDQKFWKGKVFGCKYIARYGGIGTDGKSKVKLFDTYENALGHLDKLKAIKIRKGYKVKKNSNDKENKRDEKTLLGIWDKHKASSDWDDDDEFAIELLEIMHKKAIDDHQSSFFFETRQSSRFENLMKENDFIYTADGTRGYIVSV